MKHFLFRSIICLFLIMAVVMTVNAVHTSAAEDDKQNEQSQTEPQGKIVNISYDPYWDELSIITDADMSVWIALLKKDEGCSLQKKNFKEISCHIRMDGGKFSGSISLSNKDDFKIAENKDAYFHVTATQPATGKETYEPNFVVKGCPYKLSKIELDYVAASKTYAYEAGIKSFILKGSDGTTEYSKDKNYSEFFSMLSQIAYGRIEAYDSKELKEYKNECSVESEIYYKAGYRLLVDNSKSNLPQGLKIDNYIFKYDEIAALTGKYTFSLESGTYERRDIESPLNWIFTYADDEEKRLYLYDCNITSEDGCSWDIGYYDLSRGKMIFRNISGEHKVGFVCLPQEKPDLNGKKFIYYEDKENGIQAGFYETVSGGDELVEPLKPLSDYNLDLWRYSAEASKTGVRVTFAEASYDTLTAADLGFSHMEYSGEGTIQEGSYFTVGRYPDFEYSNETLRDAINELAENSCEDDGKLKIVDFFRYLGSDHVGNTPAVRSGPKVYVTVKKPGKSVKLKVSEKTDSFVLKNGFDFSIDGDSWYTILPYSKDGTAPSAIISTEDYVSVKKAADKPEAFTNEKIKAISVITLIEQYGMRGGVLVRKSAKTGTPASMCAEENDDFSFGDPAPILEVLEDNPEYIAISDDKDTFTLPKIEDSEESYEYIIIDAKDFKAEMANPGTIDPTSMKWTKYKAKGQKLTIDKSKSKYKLASEEKAEARVLAEGSYVLVRIKSAKYTEKDGKHTYIWYRLANDYYVAKVGKATVNDAERYVLQPDNSIISFMIDYEGTGNYERFKWELVIPKGGKIKARQFPEWSFKGRNEFEGRGYKLVGWSTEKGADTPNVTTDTYYNLPAIMVQDI